MLDKRIIFEEGYESKEYRTTTLYFIAPKEMLNGKYPEAESMEISVEFPTEHPEANYADVMFSPTKDGEDYDWYGVNLPYDEVEALIQLSERGNHGVLEEKEEAADHSQKENTCCFT